MFHYRNITFCCIISAVFVTFGDSNSVKQKLFTRSPQLSKTLQSPEAYPVERKSNTNSSKLTVNEFTKTMKLSKLGSSNLNGFQYEIYFPPHQKFNEQPTSRKEEETKSSTSDIITSETSEFKSVLPFVRDTVRNMEIRPTHDDDGQHELEQVKESDVPELVGYFYDPPPSTSTETTCDHSIEHDTPEGDGYFYEPPLTTDPVLDENRRQSVRNEQSIVSDNNVDTLQRVSQSNENYFPSASNQQAVVRERENTHQVDSEVPNYSSVNFRSSFFGENGLPRVAQDGESDKIPPEYNFVYVIRGETEFGHEELLVDETRRGAYHVLLPDGRLQHVQYEADAGGFRPVVRYHQP